MAPFRVICRRLDFVIITMRRGAEEAMGDAGRRSRRLLVGARLGGMREMRAARRRCDDSRHEYPLQR